MSFTVKLKTAVLTTVAIVGSVVVLVFSDTFKAGVKSGLALCADSVIPSLFLFTAVALFIAKSRAAGVLGGLISPVTRVLFGLDGKCSTVFLMSAVSGYPVGARLVNSLYCDHEIARGKAVKMLIYTVNAGPAFILTAVGEGVLGSRSDGLRLLTVHILSSLILAAAVRFIPDSAFGGVRQSTKKSDINSGEYSSSDLFVISIAEAGQTMLSVCFFVVLFSALGFAVSKMPFTGADALGAAVEVTSGLYTCSRAMLQKAAFLLGFGGISVIFQVMSAAGGIRPPLWLIVLSRLVHGALSAVFIAALEWLCPRDFPTGSFNVQPSDAAVHTSPFATAALMLLCVTMLTFTINIKNHAVKLTAR